MVAVEAIEYHLAVVDAFVEHFQAYYDIKHALFPVEDAGPCPVAYILL